MGNRLTKIYTRTGDAGTTGLAGGERVDKGGLRVEAMGEVDELNSCVGVLLSHMLPDFERDLLIAVQHQLFDLGGELAMPGTHLIAARHTAFLEERLDRLNADLPPLKEFILPSGSPACASCHVARSVCRRAERALARLTLSESLNPEALAYINRLSDLLFVLARVLARLDGGREVYWEQGRSG